MGAISSQNTSLTIVYPTVYSGRSKKKNQISASLAFVWGIHRSPANSPHKGPVTQKLFPFDDVIMIQTGYLRCWPVIWMSLYSLSNNTSSHHISVSLEIVRLDDKIVELGMSPVDSPHNVQWRGALMFSLICASITVEYTIETQVIWDAIAPIMTSL